MVRCCLKLIVDSLLGWLMTNQIIKKLKIGELFPGKAKFPQSNKLGKLLNFLWTQCALFVCVSFNLPWVSGFVSYDPSSSSHLQAPTFPACPAPAAAELTASHRHKNQSSLNLVLHSPVSLIAASLPV